MSGPDQAVAAALARLALACDGAVLGLTVAIAAIQTWLKFRSSSRAVSRIQRAPALRISDLRSLLTDEAASDESTERNLVLVRGHVDTQSAVDGSWNSTRDNFLLSNESSERCAILQRTQTCLYNEWRGLFGWTFNIHNLLAKSWKEHEATSLRKVPFVLIEGGYLPRAGYVVVNVDDLSHPLPLTTAYHRLHPVHATPYTFLQAMFGHGYPVGLLDEEKILPLGKEITAVGICSLQDGIPTIKSCKELPYFLSEMTKDQMVADLSVRIKILLWSGVLLGAVSFGILGYSIVRNWCRWKEWRRLRQERAQPQRDATPEGSPDDLGDVPDGELCVICLMRRRRSAFIPCGHLICCTSCALSVERDSNPKCPLCRQNIQTSIRIYGS